MKFNELMEEIESYDFNAHVNVASNFANFLQAIRQEKAVREIFASLELRENVNRVFNRMRELSIGQSDLRYENKWDVAIAVYLWLISLKDKELAIMASEIASRAQQCWWAKKMSLSILRGLEPRNDAKIETKSQVNAVFDIRGVGFSIKEKSVGDYMTLMRYCHDESEPWLIFGLQEQLKLSRSSNVQIYWGWGTPTSYMVIGSKGKSGTSVGVEA